MVGFAKLQTQNDYGRDPLNHQTCTKMSVSTLKENSCILHAKIITMCYNISLTLFTLDEIIFQPQKS